MEVLFDLANEKKKLHVASLSSNKGHLVAVLSSNPIVVSSSGCHFDANQVCWTPPRPPIV
jgi:hypothetical protein